MSGVVGGKAQTVGFRYYMSVHQAICRGPVDELLEVRVADQTAWPNAGEPGTSVTGVVSVNKPELFGGDKKEGGIVGPMHVLMGAEDQTAPGLLASLLGGRVPGFRGVVSVFFDGLVCSLNPYPKPWSFRVARIFKGWDGPVWYPDKIQIWTDDNGAKIRSMNPAHIIYECCTNRVWGRGLPRSFIDEASFRRAADQLFAENFGLNLKWAREDSLDAFVKDVIDHIGGAVDINRENGKVRLKLIRDDYDPTTLPLFEYDSGLLAIEEEETSSKDDIVNEIVVNYVSIFMNQKKQVRVHNLAAVQSAGNFKSITTDYNGISSTELALRVAQRDLKANALSGRRYKLTLDRRAWRLAPADVIRVRVPDRGIGDLILRLGKVSDSGTVDGEITAEAVPDVFGLRNASFIKPELPGFEPPNRNAIPARYVRVEEASYRDVFRGMVAGQSPNVTETTGYIVALAAKPTSLSLGYDLAAGAQGEEIAVRATESFMPVGVLQAVIGRYDTKLSLISGIDLDRVTVGTALFVGSEIMRVDAIDANNRITVGRGCVDTVPAPHAAGTVCYFSDEDLGSDGREYAVGETVSVKLLTYTSFEQLAIEDATAYTTIIRGRAFKPYPPGDFRIDGDLPGSTKEYGSSFRLTWKHRDRIIQQDKLFDNSAGNFGPEANVTYRLRFYKGNDLVRTEEQITETSFEYTDLMNVADGGTDALRIELEAVRGGIASHQKYSVLVLRD